MLPFAVVHSYHQLTPRVEVPYNSKQGLTLDPTLLLLTCVSFNRVFKLILYGSGSAMRAMQWQAHCQHCSATAHCLLNFGQEVASSATAQLAIV